MIQTKGIIGYRSLGIVYTDLKEVIIYRPKNLPMELSVLDLYTEKRIRRTVGVRGCIKRLKMVTCSIQIFPIGDGFWNPSCPPKIKGCGTVFVDPADDQREFADPTCVAVTISAKKKNYPVFPNLAIVETKNMQDETYEEYYRRIHNDRKCNEKYQERTFLLADFEPNIQVIERWFMIGD